MFAEEYCWRRWTLKHKIDHISLLPKLDNDSPCQMHQRMFAFNEINVCKVFLKMQNFDCSICWSSRQSKGPVTWLNSNACFSTTQVVTFWMEGLSWVTCRRLHHLNVCCVMHHNAMATCRIVPWFISKCSIFLMWHVNLAMLWIIVIFSFAFPLEGLENDDTQEIVIASGLDGNSIFLCLVCFSLLLVLFPRKRMAKWWFFCDFNSRKDIATCALSSQFLLSLLFCFSCSLFCLCWPTDWKWCFSVLDFSNAREWF